MKTPLLSALFALPLLIPGCASYRYEPTLTQIAATGGGSITDAVIWQHADESARTLEGRCQTARVAREISGTAQVLLAGLSGCAAVASSGATTVAALAFGSATVPRLGEVFDAKNRASIFASGAAEIRIAMSGYLDEMAEKNTAAPASRLTKSGAKLSKAVDETKKKVAIALHGTLPSLAPAAGQ